MDEPAINMVRLPYDDSAWRVFIRASNGEFACALEFYTDDEELNEFGHRLAAFPSETDDDARFELGSRDGGWAFYLLLRAFLIDRAGHAALEVAADNCRESADAAQASFFIPCEATAINRLGRQLRAWLNRSDESLSWATVTA